MMFFPSTSNFFVENKLKVSFCDMSRTFIKTSLPMRPIRYCYIHTEFRLSSSTVSDQVVDDESLNSPCIKQ